MPTGTASLIQTQAGQPLQTSPVSGITKSVIPWTSNGAGSVSFTTAIAVTGILLRRIIIPAAAGNAPSANYTMTLKDQNGIDILDGSGASLSATLSTDQCDSIPISDGVNTGTMPRAISDALTLDVSNAGNAKQGQLVLYTKLP